MLTIHSSNRLEQLIGRLAEKIGTPASANPLVPEVVVAERGVDRWLMLQLAQRQGIAANIDIQLPAGFVWQALRTLFPGAPRQSPYDRGALTWRLMSLLDPAQLDDAKFEPVKQYLAGGEGKATDMRKRYQLARRLAELFDQYLVYRHSMVLGWERGHLAGADPDATIRASTHGQQDGTDEAWQVILWRRIVAKAGGEHRARLLDRFLDADRGELLDRFFAAARDGAVNATGLPGRVSVFAVPALPPAYVAVLAALGEHIDVDLYAVNPSAEFWEDAIRPREQAAAFARYGDAAALHLIGDGAAGNPLLANGGARIQQYVADLADHDVRPGPDLFVEPGDGTLLARVQQGIYANAALAREALDALDDSIQIHGCYSLLREIEVLHDRLLDAFNRDATLQPHDVLVLTPDIDVAAPYVNAVFGTRRGPERDIPYTVSDIARGAEHPLAGAFRALLALPESRLTASEVLGLLETPAISRRFGKLTEGDHAAIRRWVAAAGIRWGIDAADRARQHLPEDDAHSWKFGFERLFLGLTMPDDDTLVAGRAPYTDVEGRDGIVLGQLQAFVDKLASARKRLTQPQTAQQWRDLIALLLRMFFDASETAEQRVVDQISGAAAEFRDELTLAGYDEPIAPEVFRADFEARLAQPGKGGGWLRGAVTFARLTPARSLPFRMICLVGMNHDRFPRRETPTTFDLIAARPRRGDRSRREDDRHLFLETLISARDRLYISYTDRSLRDSSPLQPSVVVSELIDAICGPEPDPKARKALRERLVTQHPLQPFSRGQYDGRDPRIYSYDRDWVPAAVAAGGARAPRAAFCPQPLPAIADDVGDPSPHHAAEPGGEIRLADLHRCLRHPARWFMERRLGVFLGEDQSDDLEDDEPFTLPDDFASKDAWIRAVLAGRSDEETFAAFKARGELPQGSFARIDWEERAERLATLVRRLKEDARDYRSLDVDLVLDDGRRLVGRLDAVAPGRAGDLVTTQRIWTTADKPHARMVVDAWIDHLVLCAMSGDAFAAVDSSVEGDASADGDFAATGNAPTAGAASTVGDPCSTRIDASDPNETIVLGPLPAAKARELLGELVALYDESLSRPLRFFPKSAWAYANAKKPEQRMFKAQLKWNGPKFQAATAERRSVPERSDEVLAVCFGHEENALADEEFSRLAERVFGPVVACRAVGASTETEESA